MAPTLFNVYTNDQPIGEQTQHFAYTDANVHIHLIVMAQCDNIEMVENKLEIMLKTLEQYYHRNHLKSNPSKTQVYAFHLRDKQTNRKKKVK